MTKYKFVLSLAFVSLLALPGCTVWSNFTTYFNLYYNVSKDFNQAETLIREQRKDIFSLLEPSLPGNSNQLLGKVIEKCSKVLQFNSESSFVDDALMMLGKAFYYQKNYLKSLRKFQEIIVTQQQSALVLEARLWEAKSEIALRNYSTGLSLLEKNIEEAAAADENEIMTEGYISLVRYYLNEKDDQRAIRFLLELVSRCDDSQVNGLAMYKIGELYLKNEDYQLAADAFNRVLTFTIDFETEFSAKLKLATVKRDLGESREALEDYQSLRSEAKYSDKYDVIDLEIGRTLKAMGKPEDAFAHFKYIDTTYNTSVYSAGIKYEIANLFENDFGNFDSAAVYYQKGLAAPSTADYLDSLRSKTQLFTKYTTVSLAFTGNKRDLYYAMYPDKFSADSAAYFGDTIKAMDIAAAPVEEQTKTEITRERERDFGEEELQKAGAPPVKKDSTRAAPPVKPTLSADSLRTLVIKNSLELGNLFFTEFELNDSAYYYYNYITSNFTGPYLMEPKVLFALGSYYLSVDDSVRADSLFNYIYDNFKTDNTVNAAAVKLGKPQVDFDFDPAKQLYIDAEEIMLQGDYQKSYSDFYKIFLQHPKSTYASKSLFACGYLLENNIKLPDSAVSVYDTLIKYFPQSAYAATAGPKVSFYRSEKLRIEANRKDSLMRIEQEKVRKAKEDSLKNVKPSEIRQEQPAAEDPGKTIDPEKQEEPEKKAEEPGRFSLRPPGFYPDRYIYRNALSPVYLHRT